MQQPIPEEPEQTLASIGIYVFSLELLLKVLREDHEDQLSSHDFERDIIPKLIATHPVYAYHFWR